MRFILIRALLALGFGLAAWTVTPQLLAMRLAHASPNLDGLTRALRFDARNAKLHVQLARLYRAGSHERYLDGALRHLERAVELNPHAWSFRVELADLYAGIGRDEAAEAQLLEARSRDPIGPQTAWALGRFHLRAGEIDRALPFFLESMWARPRFLRAGVPQLLEAGVSPGVLVDTAPEDRRSRLRLLRQLVRSADLAPGAGPDEGPRDGPRAMMRLWRGLQRSDTRPTGAEAEFFLDYLLASGQDQLASEVRRDLSPGTIVERPPGRP